MELLSSTAQIWQDILAQAVTGELVAAMNYTALADICDDPVEKVEALEHALRERGHAAAFVAEGRKLGVDVQNNIDGKHWKRLRESFRCCVDDRDVTSCLIVQEIMLESLAVASYARVERAATGSLGRVFGAIAAEEEEHIGHAVAILRAQRAVDLEAFDAKLERLHFDVMSTLAEMLAKDCRTGHCEVCHGTCVKPALFDVSLSAAELRGASLQRYLKTLDLLGIPGETSLAWVARLPV